MPAGSAEEIADRLISGASARTEKYRSGVRSPKRNAVDAAIKSKAKMAAKVAASINDGTWERNLRASSSTAVELAATKGGDHLASGLAAAKPKIVKFFQVQQPLNEAISNAVKDMDTSTYEAAKAKANKVMDLMHATKGKAKGG